MRNAHEHISETKIDGNRGGKDELMTYQLHNIRKKERKKKQNRDNDKRRMSLRPYI